MPSNIIIIISSLLRYNNETDVSSLEVVAQNNLLEAFKQALCLFWCKVISEMVRILHEVTNFVLCYRDTARLK